MPTTDRRPRRRRQQAHVEFQTDAEASAACDAARVLPEPQRSERQRELVPALKRFVMRRWQTPRPCDPEWLDAVVQHHYIEESIFRPLPPPAGYKPERSE